MLNMTNTFFLFDDGAFDYVGLVEPTSQAAIITGERVGQFTGGSTGVSQPRSDRSITYIGNNTALAFYAQVSTSYPMARIVKW